MSRGRCVDKSRPTGERRVYWDFFLVRDLALCQIALGKQILSLFDVDALLCSMLEWPWKAYFVAIPRGCATLLYTKVALETIFSRDFTWMRYFAIY